MSNINGKSFMLGNLKLKYTTSAIALLVATWHQSENISKFLKFCMAKFAKAEPAITNAAKIINQLSDNKSLDKVTDAWIKMESEGGLQKALQNGVTKEIYKCAEKMHINEQRAKEVVECLKQTIPGSDSKLEKITKFVECSHMNLVEAVSALDKATLLGQCISKDFADHHLES